MLSAEAEHCFEENNDKRNVFNMTDDTNYRMVTFSDEREI